MILLILSVLLSLTTGFFLLSTIWQCERGFFCHFSLKLSLSIGVGLGVSAVFSLLSLVFFGIIQVEAFFTCLLVLIVLASLVSRHQKKKAVSICEQLSTRPNTQSLLSKGFGYTFLLAFLLACCVPLFVSLTHPNGDWDAWAIWNEHARMIFQSAGNWTRVFSPNLAHADYPLLLPLAIARLWAYSETDTLVSPIIISLLFTIGTILLLFSAIAQAKSRLQGYLVGFCLLSTPSFLYAGASQYADIPLGFFYLSTFVFLTLALKVKNNTTLLFCTGFSLLCALFTKNEGYLFASAAILSLLIKFRFQWFFKAGRYLLIGLLPVFTLVLYIKLRYAPTNDIFVNQNTQTFSQRITDLTRYETVVSFFLTHSLSFGSFLINLPGALFFYTLLTGIRIEDKLRKPIIITFLTIIITFLGYYFIYIITPYDLHWHVTSSLDRLFLQLWPSILYLLFLVLPTPESILSYRKQML